MGDNVRVRSTPETREAGVAGLFGRVYGETTPSVTNVEVVGACVADRAINVYFADSGRCLWFPEDLLDLQDHGAGTEIRIGTRRLIRTADGEWVEGSDDDSAGQPG